jgi:diguanylate cyclase (GGDEF)-like protein
VGDEVLRRVGMVCREQTRATDLIGRMGGEEFAVLMPNTHAGDALVLLDRLRAGLAEAEVCVGGVTVGATASLGLAELRDGEDFDPLYARTDAALYAAKQAGRNRIVVAEASSPP